MHYMKRFYSKARKATRGLPIEVLEITHISPYSNQPTQCTYVITRIDDVYWPIFTPFRADRTPPERALDYVLTTLPYIITNERFVQMQQRRYR